MMRSAVWAHYRLDRETRIAWCTHCSHTQEHPLGSTPRLLRPHLREKHGIIPALPIKKPEKPNPIVGVLLPFIVSGSHPFALVEDPAFVRLLLGIKALDWDGVVPRARTLRAASAGFLDDELRKVREGFAPHAHCQFDGATVGGLKFLVITLSTLNGVDGAYLSRAVAINPVSNFCTPTILESVRQATSGITLLSATTDGGANVRAAADALCPGRALHCGLHMLSLMLAPLLAPCGDIWLTAVSTCAWLRQSPRAWSVLKEKKGEGKVTRPPQYVATRPLSVKAVVEFCLEHHSEIVATYKDCTETAIPRPPRPLNEVDKAVLQALLVPLGRIDAAMRVLEGVKPLMGAYLIQVKRLCGWTRDDEGRLLPPPTATDGLSAASAEAAASVAEDVRQQRSESRRKATETRRANKKKAEEARHLAAVHGSTTVTIEGLATPPAKRKRTAVRPAAPVGGTPDEIARTIVAAGEAAYKRALMSKWHSMTTACGGMLEAAAYLTACHWLDDGEKRIARNFITALPQFTLPPLEKPRVADYLGEPDVAERAPSSLEDEFRLYELKEPHTDQTAFWRHAATRFPRLAAAARRVLGGAASSADAERAVKSLKRTMNKQRRNLDPKIAGQLAAVAFHMRRSEGTDNPDDIAKRHVAAADDYDRLKPKKPDDKDCEDDGDDEEEEPGAG